VTPGRPPAALPSPPPAVYFASDYGTSDEFVGVVHAVLHRRAPGVPVLDLSHEIPPFDVGSGSDLLVRCAPVLGPGVVLAVVDPGVGSDRRAVALRIGRSTSPTTSSPRWLVGPDNGLLLAMADAGGGIAEARAIDREAAEGRGWTAVAGARTFDGRDLFAPAAAHLVIGGALHDLGPLLDPLDLVPAPRRPRPEVDRDGGVSTRVSWVDRFGNVQLDLGPEALEPLPEGAAVDVVVAGVGTGSYLARPVGSYADLEAGQLGLLVDANGRLSLVCDRASASELLGRPPPGAGVHLQPRRPADRR
jgi:S-adenosylmethionine hydrolase